MANNRGPDDFDALLAEVDQSLSGGASTKRTRTPARRAAAEPATRGAGTARIVVPAAAVAAVIGVVFLFLPFLGLISGAAGAFLGALIAGLWARWSR